MRYDFALLFTVLTALTGLIWLVDALAFAPARRRRQAEENAAFGQLLEALATRIRGLVDKERLGGVEIGRNEAGIGIGLASPADVERLRRLLAQEMPDLEVQAEGDGLQALPRETGVRTREPVVVDYARSFFPVILIILLLRSFVAEPYRIPSESMMPNLLIGDFILVNKYTYGLRLPVLDTKFLRIGEPRRGDVIVFHPPIAPDQVWIKRVIGLPGDVISYQDYQLTVNGQPVPREVIGVGPTIHLGGSPTATRLVREDLPGHSHTLLEADIPAPFRDPRASGTWTVPAGYYFMMGDDRDNSEDSRFWPTHFLPEQNIVGKAELVWLNVDWSARKMDTSRIGTIIR